MIFDIHVTNDVLLANFSTSLTTFSCSDLSSLDTTVNAIVELDFIALDTDGYPHRDEVLSFTTDISPVSWSSAHTNNPPGSLSVSVQRDQEGIKEKYLTSFTFSYAATYQFKILYEGVQVGPSCNVTFQSSKLRGSGL